MRNNVICFAGMLLLAPIVQAGDYHVAPSGNDADSGSSASPFRTIQRAAELAQPGDRIIVHEGVYRERIDPPRGGESDEKRIVYQAAPGENVEIRGSEVVKSWAKVQDAVWKTTVSNSVFGDFNPFGDLIHGDWFNAMGREHHTGAVYLNGKWLSEAASLDDVLKPVDAAPLWFGQVDEKDTTIWAQFPQCDPNEQRIEVNVRRTLFYPSKPGINFITVRGFVLRHAATPWAPPTAEQIGLIGTHWSKGWVIENNEISHSRCSGVTLGKYGDQWDNTSANSAEGYVKTIERALENGWSREAIGHHIVRNNVIHDCEQTGICGSLGAIFSEITGNHMHSSWTKRQFTGAEMGGIKIHASIDMLIKNNRIHNCGRGIWMDWMAQGTRLTGNLCYDNTTDDLFVEVNHGPFLVDNNLLLSGLSLRDWSEGGAFVHNLMTGKIESRPVLGRSTPFHPAHSTTVAGLRNIQGGDHRFYNNILVGTVSGSDDADKQNNNAARSVGFGLAVYDKRPFPVFTGGNVFCHGARPYFKEVRPTLSTRLGPEVNVVEDGEHVLLNLKFGPYVLDATTTIVTTQLLGNAKIPKLPFVNRDGSPLKLDVDFFGKKRTGEKPTAGPFELPGEGNLSLEVW